MKKSAFKNTILLVMAMAFSGLALADHDVSKPALDKPQEKHDKASHDIYVNEGEKCNQTGEMASSNKTALLYCSSTKVWRNEQHAAPVTVFVTITKGDGLIYDTWVSTLDGQPQTYSFLKEASFVSKVRETEKTVEFDIDKQKTGVSVEATPEVQSDKRIKTDISLSIISADKADNASMHQAFMLNSGDPIKKQVGDYTVKISAEYGFKTAKAQE